MASEGRKVGLLAKAAGAEVAKRWKIAYRCGTNYKLKSTKYFNFEIKNVEKIYTIISEEIFLNLQNILFSDSFSKLRYWHAVMIRNTFLN